MTYEEALKEQPLSETDLTSMLMKERDAMVSELSVCLSRLVLSSLMGTFIHS